MDGKHAIVRTDGNTAEIVRANMSEHVARAAADMLNESARQPVRFVVTATPDQFRRQVAREVAR